MPGVAIVVFAEIYTGYEASRHGARSVLWASGNGNTGTEDPPVVALVFEVVFLDGQQEPFLDSRDGWRTDGIEWKVRMDCGVDVVDYRGAVTNAGA